MKLVVVSTLLLMITSCAHHRDVRPGEETHKVIIQTSSKEEGSRMAISQANHYCKQSGKQPVFTEEDQKYTGDMDEKSYQAGKKASDVAKVIGGTAYTLGGKNEKNAGGLIGLGGLAADAALGKGYTVTMSFKCR